MAWLDDLGGSSVPLGAGISNWILLTWCFMGARPQSLARNADSLAVTSGSKRVSAKAARTLKGQT